jgi:hypothetical protein
MLMEYPDIGKIADWQRVAEKIRRSDQPEIEKLAFSFRWITDSIIEHGMKDIELARALRDEDSVIKNQIKTEAIRHARAIFQTCHLLAAGRKAWDD